VNDYDALRDHLKKQTLPNSCCVRADRGIVDAVAAARRAPRVVVETLRSPQEKIRSASPASPPATSRPGSRSGVRSSG